MALTPEERKARARERAAQWRVDNRERHRAYSREWTRQHPDRNREKCAAWYKENPDRVRANRQRWKTENRDRHLETSREDARRRYLNRDGGAYSYSLVLRADPCSYCDAPAGAVDHVDPLSGGGENAWENLTATCVPCNSSKRDKPLLLWMVER